MDILCISSIDWDFNWQTHQQVMSTLAKQGHRVLFVENTGLRAPTFRDAPRLVHRLRNWWRGFKGFRQEADNLFVYSPLLLPFPHARVARWVNRAILTAALRRWMRASGFAQPVLWTFLPTRLVVDLIDRVNPALVVYQCLADFEQLTSKPSRIARSERLLLDRADVVLAQGAKLAERCAPHPNVHVFAPGVDLDAFAAPAPAPLELASMPRPILGYIGGIHRHVDLDLLERIADTTSGSLVLVGPLQSAAPALQARSNVVLTGPQPHSRIPAFVKAFDVGLIPYVVSDYTETVYPSKFNEYLAAGIPIVSTPLPEICRERAALGDVVDIAKSPQEFLDAIHTALAKTNPGAIELRTRAAAANAWSVRIAGMWAVIESALEERTRRLEPWDVRLRRAYRATRQRLAGWIVAIAVLWIALFYTPFIWMIAAPLQIVDPPRQADAIVVFAGGVGESGQPGGGYQERVKQAIDLYGAGLAPQMVFSSGYVFAFQETDVMKSLAVANGVPADAILLERRAANTYENVKFVNDIIARRGWKTVLLVSSPYHMRRALLTWRRVAPGTTIIAAPVPRSQFYEHNWGANLEQVRAIAQEYAAIVAYWWKGWI